MTEHANPTGALSDLLLRVVSARTPGLPFERAGLALLEDPETAPAVQAKFRRVLQERASEAAELPAGGVPLDVVERELLTKALARTRNNKSQAARLLGLTRGQLYSLLRRHGLTDARR